jgi:Histidine kinase-, DNA gyrase B-, and HSP90-like ATPase/Type I restriction enzyme R protein N terminus (HSDR_N)
MLFTSNIAARGDLMVSIPTIREDFPGRVRNFALGASTPGNALIPVYEAVQNSLQAVASQFKSRAAKSGRISVSADRSEGDAPSFIITDNGIGLDDANFESFLTLDSEFKLSIGGKGVGRITWVKVFESVEVTSVYLDQAGTQKQRSFVFRADKQPFSNYSERKVFGTKVGTRVALKRMKPQYAQHCPAKIETIAGRIISHFLAQFLSPETMSIIVDDDTGTLNLRDVLAGKMFDAKADAIKDDEDNEFTIQHMLIARDVVSELGEHSLFFVADKRIVLPHGLNNQIGITKNIDHNGIACKYVGLVSGDLLDKNVATERNRFDLDSTKIIDLSRQAVDKVKIYLKSEIDAVVHNQIKQLEAVIEQFPRYSYLVDDAQEFAVSKLPLNAGNSEEIYKHLSVYDYRASRDIIRDVSDAVKASDEASIDTEAKKIVERILAQERSSLLEYVAKRKLIIDLLYARLGYEDLDERKRFTEEAIHSIICPLRVTANDIKIDDHNLWLIDEKLAYYEFWASDKQIQDFVQDSESRKRPDIILFQGPTLFQRLGGDQPVVIIEFKRPARKEYSDDENPVAQLYDYIRDLRARKVVNKDGVLITAISEETPFFCYIIADITPKLEHWLDNQQIKNRIPGGRGYFGYHSGFRSYIEIVNIESVVRDARLRHEAFFKRLGIN